jgi:hypothetical protein
MTGEDLSLNGKENANCSSAVYKTFFRGVIKRKVFNAYREM